MGFFVDIYFALIVNHHLDCIIIERMGPGGYNLIRPNSKYIYI